MLDSFCRIQNLHISQTVAETIKNPCQFCRIQNLHISQTDRLKVYYDELFCRIQNLHISQTKASTLIENLSFVEFKIYISLKRSTARAY